MSNRTEIENSLQELSGEVKTQLGEFQRIVELSSFLVDQTRRFKEDLISYEQTISEKDGEAAELREREQCILEDWKKEQAQSKGLQEELLQAQDNAVHYQTLSQDLRQHIQELNSQIQDLKSELAEAPSVQTP